MPNTEYQLITHTLDPVYDEHSRILILGSFPSVKTRENGFYYGHPQNRFWPVMEALFDQEIARNLESQRAFLLDHKIALYDVIYQCEIIGSSDASIREVVPTDLRPIIETGDIQAIYMGGGTAQRYYQRYHAEALGRKAIQLPSMSPANARYRLDDLVQAWSVIKEYL